MVSAVVSRPPLDTPSAVAPELERFATCPSCHTADATMTNAAVQGGADWQCARCAQRWDAARLATAAAYAVWLSGHTSSFDSFATTGRGDV